MKTFKQLINEEIKFNRLAGMYTDGYSHNQKVGKHYINIGFIKNAKNEHNRDSHEIEFRVNGAYNRDVLHGEERPSVGESAEIFGHIRNVIKSFRDQHKPKAVHFSPYHKSFDSLYGKLANSLGGRVEKHYDMNTQSHEYKVHFDK